MNYLLVENLSKSFGIKTLFEDISFSIDEGQKVALIAKNGTGKSTLLKIIANLDTADKGTIYLRKEIRTVLLEQAQDFDESKTIREIIYNKESLAVKAIFQYQDALNRPNDTALLQSAFEAMEMYDAWSFEAKVKLITHQLQIEELNQPVQQLSGGQKKRLALTKVLLEAPDFLLLDEPTNHLDIEMTNWLEEYLNQQNITLLMITHDRYFLENVCTQILELDKGILYKHKGNYSYYLEKKAAREDNEKSNLLKNKNLFRSELEWIRKQPQGRGTKAKSRVDAFYELKDKAHKNIDQDKVDIQVLSRRIGNKILELHHVSKSFGDNCMIKDFSYKFKERERIGIVGKNGVGKSTFLQIITGNLLPDTGKILKGETIHLGYYTQDGLLFKDDKRVIEVLKDIAEFIPLKGGKTLSASQLLETFLFDTETQYTLVSKLSGGEKRRLYLLTILMQNPNFLILDEPTNDLDVLTLQVLEDFLNEFPGCVLTVSHDRYFMDRLTEQLFVFEGNGIIRLFNGSYSFYKAIEDDNKLNAKQAKSAISTQPETPKSNLKITTKISYHERREWEQLNIEIPKIENDLKSINDEIAKGNLEGQALLSSINSMTKLTQLLEEKEMRWLILSDKMN